MKTKSVIMHYPLFAAVLCAAMPHVAYGAGVRVGNASRSYANAYNQVAQQRMQADMATQQQYAPVMTTSAAAASAAAGDDEIALPVRVANANLAKQIIRGDTTAKVGISQLESCGAIYPNGEFAWDTPTAGRGAGGAQTCVAVVEMRGVQMGAGGSDAILARANVAAGDAVKCNISEFPESGYTTDAGNITFPADAEPTVDDVVRVMNDEQKQKAGLKIAAGAIIGGLGGNIAGKNEVGEDSLMGTGKHKMQSTLVGALGGAALGAGNAYAGKVGGDVILSTGVNAAAGGVVGNIAASGDSVLRIEDCVLPDKTKTTCLWGMIVTKKDLNLSDSSQDNYKTAFININDSTTYVCDGNAEGDEWKNCKEQELVSIKLDAYPNGDLDEARSKNFEAITRYNANQYKLIKSEKGDKSISKGFSSDGTYAKISVAGIPDQRTHAMIANVHDKAFGLKRSDWREIKNSKSDNDLYGRNAKGEGFSLSGSYSIQDFYPMYVDAEDGGIIDLGNKARLKSTLIGAGAGGAMGAFVGYQGAQKDIDDRWVSAVREYKDSLQKIYCVTGQRFLSFYNDTVVIPNMGQ